MVTRSPRSRARSTTTLRRPQATAVDAEVDQILHSARPRPLAAVSELVLSRLTWYATFVTLHDDFRVVEHLSADPPSRVVEPRPGTDDPVRLVLARGAHGPLRLDTAEVARGTLTARLLASLGHAGIDETRPSTARRTLRGLGGAELSAVPGTVGRADHATTGAGREVVVAPLPGESRVLGLLVAHPAGEDRAAPEEAAEALARLADQVGRALQAAQDAAAPTAPRAVPHGGAPRSAGRRRVDLDRFTDRQWYLPFDPSSVARARALVTQACADWGSRVPARTVELVVSELVANAVRHGWGSMRVAVCEKPDGLLLEVWDANPEPPVPRDPSRTPMGGFGIQIVATLARWGWRREGAGKTVWAFVPAS